MVKKNIAQHYFFSNISITMIWQINAIDEIDVQDNIQDNSVQFSAFTLNLTTFFTYQNIIITLVIP